MRHELDEIRKDRTGSYATCACGWEDDTGHDSKLAAARAWLEHCQAEGCFGDDEEEGEW